MDGSKLWIPAADIPTDAGADCDRIAYENIAAIQPHCIFFNLCRWDRRVLNLSENCEQLGGPPHLTTLGRLCNDDLIEGVDPLLGVLLDLSTKGQTAPIQYGLVHMNGQPFVARATICKDRIQLEIEQKQQVPFYRGQAKDLLELGASTLRTAECLSDLVPFLAHLNELLPFSRLGIYRFDEISHGEILFEKRLNPNTISYEGLRFPARDIPLSARKMMLSNPVRFTRDRSLTPSRITPRKDPINQQEIDLSLSRNRGSFGSCQEYYSNMGIRSSMILPLVVEQKLWGMICGHHDSVVNITADFDPYLISLGNMLAGAIRNIQHNERTASSQRGRSVVTSFRKDAKDSTSAIENLKAHTNELMEMIPCDGLILYVAGNLLTSGSVPDSTNLKAYTKCIWENANSKILLSNHIKQAYPALHALSSEFAGVLAVPLDTDHQDIAIWLRKEQLREVRWAGAPSQNVRQKSNGSYFLEPRTSFEVWTQAMQGVSRDWSENEVQLAESSGMQLSLVLLSWYSSQSTTTKSTFLSRVSHQLRTPLTALLGYAELMRSSLHNVNENSLNECREYSHIITRSGSGLLSMVNEIVDLTRLESGDMVIERVRVDIPQMIQEIVSELTPSAIAHKLRFQIEIVGSIPRFIMTDPVRLRQIVTSLLSNSIKCMRDGQLNLRLSTTDHRHPKLHIAVLEAEAKTTQDQLKSPAQGLFNSEAFIAQRFGALGIGYMICQKIADLLGGDVCVENVKGIAKGMIVTIALQGHSSLDEIDQAQFNQQYLPVGHRHLPTMEPHSVAAVSSVMPNVS